jgi:hypothetical protein
VEVNASDTRNKADKSAKTGMGGKLSNIIKELVNNTALGIVRDGHRKRVRPAWTYPSNALATSIHALMCGQSQCISASCVLESPYRSAAWCIYLHGHLRTHISLWYVIPPRVQEKGALPPGHTSALAVRCRCA